MEKIHFEGQQEGEKVFYTILPHPLAYPLALVKISILALFFVIICLIISSAVLETAGLIQLVGILLGTLVFVAGVFWNKLVYKKSKTYLTNRRIIRFEVMTPFFTTKRALFWNEALKAKGYFPNILAKIFQLGTLQVEPHLSEHEDVLVREIAYAEDLANYVDKILFTFKTKPDEVDYIKPFVAKPRGQRG